MYTQVNGISQANDKINFISLHRDCTLVAIHGFLNKRLITLQKLKQICTISIYVSLI